MARRRTHEQEVDLELAETLRRECKTLQITAGELLCGISWSELTAAPWWRAAGTR